MKVLFVCTGNTCRSPMAEALLNKAAAENMAVESADDITKNNISATSAGIMAYAGDPASPHAHAAVAALGGNLSRHRSRRVSEEMLADADLILTMTEGQARQLQFLGHAEKIHPLLRYVGLEGDIHDPYGGEREVYDATARQIMDAVRRLVQILHEKS